MHTAREGTQPILQETIVIEEKHDSLYMIPNIDS